jgi:hypothetical protein
MKKAPRAELFSGSGSGSVCLEYLPGKFPEEIPRITFIEFFWSHSSKIFLKYFSPPNSAP